MKNIFFKKTCWVKFEELLMHLNQWRNLPDWFKMPKVINEKRGCDTVAGWTETSRRGVGFMSGCGGGRATNSCTQWLAFLHLVFFPVAQWDSWVSAPQAVPSNPQLNQQLNQPWASPTAPQPRVLPRTVAPLALVLGQHHCHRCSPPL